MTGTGSVDLARAIRSTPDGIELAVRVIPRGGASRVAGLRDGSVLIRLAAAPVEGAANDALIALLSRALKLPARNVTIAGGARSRNKRVLVAGIDSAGVRERLGTLLR